MNIYVYIHILLYIYQLLRNLRQYMLNAQVSTKNVKA